MALPTEILQKVDQITLGYTAHAYQSIVGAHHTEIHLMLVAYFAVFGLAVLQGMVALSMKEIIRHVLKALIIFQLATNWGSFTTFFYNGFTSGPEKITQALIGGSKPTEQLEEVFTTGVEAARQINQKAGTLDIAQMFLALLVLLGTVLMTGVALFLLILSKMGLAILLSLAPIFMALALWKGTQGLFQGWINYLINYAMIPIITFALLALTLQLMKEPVSSIQQSGENLTMATIIPYLLMGAISTMLFSQVLRIAAALGGGVALSTMGALSRYMTQPGSSLARLGMKQLSGRSSSGKALGQSSQGSASSSFVVPSNPTYSTSKVSFIEREAPHVSSSTLVSREEKTA